MAMKEKDLLKKFLPKAYLSGGETYLPISVGAHFIGECLRENIAVLGVDFFHRRDGFIIPVDPLNSVDCSEILCRGYNWSEIVSTTCAFALYALLQERERDSSQWCTFILLEEEGWRRSQKLT
jgi:hypothetical protein